MNISNGTNSTLLVGSPYADKIVNKGEKVTVKAEFGNDNVENYGANSKIYLSYGDDYVRNNSAKVLIDGGAGNDKFLNYGKESSIITGTGYDEVENYGDYSAINTNIGDNYVYNEGAGVKINGGKGNDSVNNGGDKTIIKSGGGNDSINSHAEYVSIDGGAGDNIINNNGNYASIKSDKGNDSILNHGDKVTIQSGAGTDIIYNYGEYVLVNMSSGNNYFYDYQDRTTLNGGTSNDLVFSNGHSGLYKTGGGDDSIIATGNFFTIDGGAGNDNISVTSDYTSLTGGAGNDIITVVGDRNYINGGAGTNIISSNGNKVTIEGSGGNDIIVVNGDNLNVLLSNGNNDLFFRNESKNSTIITGAGNDYIDIGDGTGFFIEVGTGGSDKIGGFNANDTIKMASAVKNSYIDGNNFIIEFDKGTLKIDDFGYSSIQAISADGKMVTLNAQPEGLTINNNDAAISVTGSDGADTISNSGKNVTISGGKGNDSITNSGANFQLNVGLGRSIITNSGANAVIDGGEGGFTLTNSGKGATINCGADTNRITNTADSVLINCADAYDSIVTSGKNVTIKTGEGTNYIEISKENTGTLIEYSEGDDNILMVIGMGSKDTLDLNGANYLKINNGSFWEVIVGDKRLNFLNSAEDFKINGVLDDSESYTIKENLSLTIYNVAYTAVDGDAVINLDSDGKVTGLASGKVTLNVNGSINVGVDIDATKGAQNFTAETDDSSLVITKNFPIKFSRGEFDYTGETVKAAEYSTFSTSIEGAEYNIERSIYGAAQSTYKITDTEIVIESENVTLTDILNDGDNSQSIIYEFDGKVKNNLSDNSITLTKNTTGVFHFNDYDLKVTALDSAGNKLISNMDGINFTPDSGKTNVLFNYYNQREFIGGDLKCTAGKITFGYDNKINFADDTSFEFKKDGYTLTASTVNDSKVTIQLIDNEMTFKPVETEGALNVTLKKGSRTILDNTFSIAGGSVALSPTDKSNVKKFSLTQDTEIKITKDNQIITATAQADIAAYIRRDAAGILYFQIDGENAAFDLKVAESDGTENFNGEIVLGGCVAYNDKTNEIIFVSDPSNNNGNETFIQIKDGKRTIYAQTEEQNFSANVNLSDSKITATFSNKNNNSLLFKITKDEGEEEIFNNVIAVNGSFVIDLLKMDFSLNKGTIITTSNGLSIKNSTVTASTLFSGSALNLSNYENTATNADASKLSTSIEIIGSSVANSIKSGKGADSVNGAEGNDTIYGGAGADTIFGGADNDKLFGDAGNDSLNGGAGNDTLTGGKGNDVFIYESGDDLITDYKAGEDTIRLNPSAITSSTVKGSNVILTTDSGTLTLKATKDKTITFIDEEGNATDKIFFSDTSYAPLETGLTYDAKKTAITASSKFGGYMIDLNECLSTTTKVNASAVKKALLISGNDLNNSIKGGKGADIITGGAGNDTLTGGAGADTFVYGGGNDVITDYKSGEDTIMINEEISEVGYSGKNVIFTIGDGSLTVKNAKGKKISVMNADNQTQVYSRTLDILYDNNFMTDEINISDVAEITENNYSVGKIEDSTDNEKFYGADIVVSANSSDKLI